MLAAAPVAVTAVGGVPVTAEEIDQARLILASCASVAVRQPLARHGHPLAACDYHAAAAPYRQEIAGSGWGRGAAGRPVTKIAFLAALDNAALAVRAQLEARRRAWCDQMVASALAAFAADCGYVAAMCDDARRSGA
jgi:hypothetical protein